MDGPQGCRCLYFNSAVLQFYREGKSDKDIRAALVEAGFSKHVAVVDGFTQHSPYTSRGSALVKRLSKRGSLKTRGPKICKVLLEKYSVSAWLRLGGLRDDCTYSCQQCPQDELPELWGADKLNQAKRKGFQRQNKNVVHMGALGAELRVRDKVPCKKVQQQIRKRSLAAFKQVFHSRSCSMSNLMCYSKLSTLVQQNAKGWRCSLNLQLMLMWSASMTLSWSHCGESSEVH